MGRADAVEAVPPSSTTEDRLRLIVDSTPALIHTARPDGRLDYFNKPWLEYLGVTLDDVSGWKWTAFVHPNDIEGIVARWRTCLATGEIFEYETCVRRADGEYRWMFHRQVPLRDEEGDIVKRYGSSIDIEDRKQAEKALRRKEFYLAEGQRLGHSGGWVFDPPDHSPTGLKNCSESMVLIRPARRCGMHSGARKRDRSRWKSSRRNGSFS